MPRRNRNVKAARYLGQPDWDWLATELLQRRQRITTRRHLASRIDRDGIGRYLPPTTTQVPLGRAESGAARIDRSFSGSAR